MSIYEYDAEKVQRQFREQWKQMGLEEGRAEGRQTGIEISAYILQLSRQGKTVKEIVEATGENIEVVRMLLVSDSKLSFPPAANFPQIKFGSASMLSLSTCCILRHVFICHLDQIHIFPYSLIV